MGLGKYATAGEKEKINQAEKELAVIAGQKPVRTKAKKSVANFKVREGMETGPEGHAPRGSDVRVPRPDDLAGVPRA
jgi:hypothetical protein